MSDEEIYRVDTVPPPDGEGDAYNAATRVGAAPPEAVLHAMKEASRSGNPLKPQALPKGLSVPPSPEAAPGAAVAAPPPSVTAPEPPAVDALAAPSFATTATRLAIALAVVVVVFALVGR